MFNVKKGTSVLLQLFQMTVATTRRCVTLMPLVSREVAFIFVFVMKDSKEMVIIVLVS